MTTVIGPSETPALGEKLIIHSMITARGKHLLHPSA